MRTPTWLMSIALGFGLLVTGCGGGSDPELGDECDPGENSCPDNAVCAEDAEGENRCLSPVGGQCDLSSETAACVVGADCFADPDGEDEETGICAFGKGVACQPDAEVRECAPELVCAQVQGGADPFVCFGRVRIRGTVFDSVTSAGIAGAHVIALDDQATAVTNIAVTDDAGAYDLEVPDQVRDETGKPLTQSFTLRASASDYETFPGGLRTALPISTNDASEIEDAWVISTPPTEIALVQLPAEQRGRATVSGSIVASPAAGVLVVAEGAEGGFSAVSDAGGAYTIFNVPPGPHSVRGFMANLQLVPVDVEVADVAITGIDLTEATNPTSTVTGTINIVNAPGEAATSVVLVVASTFSDTFVRGEVPPGLRTPLTGPPNVTSEFSIAGVPDGDYIVLAAFENDDMVRDPDPNIAGTQIVSLSLPDPGGPTVAIDSSFKVTEALPVVSPGANLAELVTDPPTFVWGDDSSESFYSIVVFDSFGNMVWEDPDIPSVSGGDTVSVTYGGPPLQPGIWYQFRATSWRSPGGNVGPISQTEDLRGVFFVE